MSLLKTTGVCLVVALAAACKGSPTVMRFEGAESLNKNRRDESTPVEVRVFLLKDATRFDRATIEELWGDKYKQALGADVVEEPRQITVYPAANRKVKLEDVPSEVRSIGILAMFGREGGDKASRCASVPKDKADRYVFELVDYRLVLKK